MLDMGEALRGHRPDMAEDLLRGTFVRTVANAEVYNWDFAVGTSMKTVTDGVGAWFVVNR